MSKEEDALDAQFAASLKDHPVAKAVQSAGTPPNPNTTISPTTSMIRGFGSGLMFGAQPQVTGTLSTGHIPFTNMNMWGSQPEYEKTVAESANKNEDAYQQNPYSYGAGYAGGMVAPAVISGGLSGASTMLRGGGGAMDALNALKTTEGLKDAVYGLKLGAQEGLAGVVKPRPSQGPSPSLTSGASTYVRENIPGTAARVVGGATNKDPNAPLIPERAYVPGAAPPSSAAGAPQKTSMAEPSFGTLADWLATAKNSNNPAVQNEAAQSLAAMQQTQDPGANRLIAMNLQKTANGRAVMNEDSPVNEEDQSA